MELWNDRDDLALTNAYREFQDAGYDESDIEAEQIGINDMVLLPRSAFDRLIEANNTLGVAAANWCMQAKRNRRFGIGASAVAAAYIVIAVLLAVMR